MMPHKSEEPSVIKISKVCEEVTWKQQQRDQISIKDSLNRPKIKSMQKHLIFKWPYKAGECYHGGQFESEASFESQMYFGTMEKGPVAD